MLEYYEMPPIDPAKDEELQEYMEQGKPFPGSVTKPLIYQG